MLYNLTLAVWWVFFLLHKKMEASKGLHAIKKLTLIFG